MMPRRLQETSITTRLPALGFGGAGLGNLYQPVEETVAAQTIDRAWQSGIRYFDTAPYYGLGLSEMRLGRALARYPRDAFLLSTKVGRVLDPDPTADTSQVRHGFASPLAFTPRFDFSYGGIMQSYEASLQRLGLSRIDVLLVHDIGRMTHGDRNAAHFHDLATGGYRALDELRKAGDITAIGLGVNEWEICLEAMDIGQFDCFLLAGRYTLLEQSALDSFLPRCTAQGASVIIGGVYNSGILASGTRGPQPPRYNYAIASDAIIDRVARIEAIADRHGVALAAAALQFPLAHPAVSTVIPGLASASEVEHTLALMDQTIPPAFWDDLKAAGLLAPDTPVPAKAVAAIDR